jgi:hypothetical protein
VANGEFGQFGMLQKARGVAMRAARCCRTCAASCAATGLSAARNVWLCETYFAFATKAGQVALPRARPNY